MMTAASDSAKANASGSRSGSNKPNGFHLLESQLSKDQEVKELDNEYEITATVVDTEQLNWWLRGFGDAVRGIEKHSLNQNITGE